jgi:arginase
VNVSIIGVPQDYGAGRRGVDMGPSAVRVANLQARLEALGHSVIDEGNLEVDPPERLQPGPGGARHLPQIAENCSRLADLVERCLRQGRTPLVLGGDHSIALGTVAGVASQRKIGVIWIDAHGDFNTPATSPSGNVHGMPLAAIAGLGPPELTRLRGAAPLVSPANIVLAGIRDIDRREADNIRAAGIKAFTMREIDEHGLRAVMREAIHTATAGTEGFHLSLDLDALDPEFAPGVGTPVRGGLTYREAHLAMELLHDSGALLSLEAVEVNPVLDIANKTADLAVELILSALGKRIL